jgi:lysophospholipase L1-like esterase
VWAPDGSEGATITVEGRATTAPELPFFGTLSDDGHGGDERQGDRVYSGLVSLPVSSGSLRYLYFSDGAPEFEPLPPFRSTQNERNLQVEEGTFAPVERFANVYLMAERVHPDRDGQARIAAAIAKAVANFLGP